MGAQMVKVASKHLMLLVTGLLRSCACADCARLGVKNVTAGAEAMAVKEG